ncbi:hypothetical protein BBI10_25190 [Pseudomonas graminis]|uniref:Uncharacterized protein n=1 Tax=Pseudomonas graminis TaxID=158627 RepID=A0A1C2D9P3_9PSED|nr:hypothetical protein BBI10_25190 [Pseudomonas graminis]
MAQAESIREQARSHRRCVWVRDFSVMHRTCGSQLADEWVAQTKLMAEADRLRELARSAGLFPGEAGPTKSSACIQ